MAGSKTKKTSGKRAVSGKRGKPGSRNSRKTRAAWAVDVRGVWGIVLLGVGVLTLACQFIPSNGGVLNLLMLLVRGLGGRLCLLLPVLLCALGIAMAFGHRFEALNGRTVSCGVALFVIIETMLQILRANSVAASLAADGLGDTWLQFMARSYRLSSLDVSGGGLIGAVAAWPLYRALDSWGGLLVLAFAALAVLMVATGVSVGPVGAAISNVLDSLRVALGDRMRQARENREERAQNKLEREAEAAREAVNRQKAEAKAREAREQAAKAAARERQAPTVPAPIPQEEATPKPEEELPLFEGMQEALPKKETVGRARLTPVEPIARAYDQTPLYIASDDEFIRATAQPARYEDEDPDVSTEEAEYAFLHGMNSVYPSQESREPEPESEPVPDAPWEEERAEAYPPREAPQAFAADVAPEMDAASIQEQTDFPDTNEAGLEETEEEADAQDTDWAQNGGFMPVKEERTPHRRRPRHAQTAPQTQAKPGAAVSFQPQETVSRTERRLDETPIVMPVKDKHEMPEVKEEYAFPPIDLLRLTSTQSDPQRDMRDRQSGELLIQTLQNFGVKAELKNFTHGPAITRFEIQPAPGVKVSRITTLADDIALNLASDGVRIEAPVPGKPVVGIELPNRKIEMVSLRDVLETETMRKEKSPTAVALGKGIAGNAVVADLAKMPHVLIAGATGSGKSVCINTIIQSIIFRAKPSEVRLILIDPKVVELSVYNGVPHLLIPVVTDPKKASAALSWAVVEMEHRYKRFETMGVRDIRGYNAAIGENEEPMPKIIVIIDELADLMMVAPGEVEESICRLAQLARAAGIHLVIATQRPSVNVITGVIKANIPSRIAFAVSSQIDSRTILDGSGAEKLLGKGDMLFAPQGANKPTRVQGCFVSDDEVQAVVDYVKHSSTADYNEDVLEQINRPEEEEKGGDQEQSGASELSDEMLVKAIDLAIDAGQVSISMLQRRLRVGYARAGRLVDDMTQMGIVSEAEGPTKPRKTLITRDEWKRMQENGGL